MPRTIRQQVTLPGTPHEVYEALMDSATHTAFTGDAADITREVGGRFTAGDGYISGINLELAPDARIVQQWHASDWSEEAQSRATFALAPVPGGTRLTFTHSGVPDEAYEEIRSGWVEFYWEPLKAWLQSRRKG
jgi:uncharacterized protein YndB with AHSA1/START domain